MKRLNLESVATIIPVVIFIALLGTVVLFSVNGQVKRWYASRTQDPIAQKDLVYQANGVRVYKFVNEGNTCYLADDPQGGAGVYCLK